MERLVAGIVDLAVAAFAFFGVYFLWRPHRPVLARRVLAGVGVTGLVFGLTQLARGAHFPSHTFWSAWVCWTLFVLAAAARQALDGKPQDQPAPLLG
jgi:membrane-associated PAP2 superfamily phosphatase